jgi:hypothetical protein
VATIRKKDANIRRHPMHLAEKVEVVEHIQRKFSSFTTVFHRRMLRPSPSKNDKTPDTGIHGNHDPFTAEFVCKLSEEG